MTVDLKLMKQKVMLVSLNISFWNGKKYDERATGTVELTYKTKRVGRFNKDLLPGERPTKRSANQDYLKPKSYTDIVAAAGNLRQTFYKYTLEYASMKVRLLPVGAYLDWTTHLRQAIREFDILCEIFYSQYEVIKLQAKSRMAEGLFLESDYPTLDELKSKFGIKWTPLPFPDAEFLGVDLPDETLLSLNQQIVFSTTQAISSAQKDLAERLYKATVHLAERANSDGIFHTSAVENLREIIAVLPKLNFTDDRNLAELAERANRELMMFDGDQIRRQPKIRSVVATCATSIAQSMSNCFEIPFSDALSLLDGDEETEQSEIIGARQLDLLTA